MGKHLSFECRSRIEFMLSKGMSFKAIARALGKSHTTIAREVKNRAVISNKGAPQRVTNRCMDVRYFSLQKITLFRLEPRKRKSQERKVDSKCRIGRTYYDFQASLTANPDLEVAQMDTLEGTRGGKVILTIHFVSTSFMLAFLREPNTARSVQDIFENLYFLLGKGLFQKLFHILLCFCVPQ